MATTYALAFVRNRADKRASTWGDLGGVTVDEAK
jgi:hypothetical protein